MLSFGDEWDPPAAASPTANDERLAAALSATAQADGDDHRALYLRWRPRRFADVVGQDHVTRTLRNAVQRQRLAHAYLFTGPRGTGKTSVARILYRAANCERAPDLGGDPCNECGLCQSALQGRALDLLEIDAASNRGIDDIRDLRDRVSFRPSDGRYRVYILDEAHELQTAAWDAFLKTLEEPPPHAIFVLATTEAHKVPPTIVSRCQRFDFRRIPLDDTRAQLERVAASEGLDVEPVVIDRLARSARGGLRDALSLLDQLTVFGGSERVDMEVATAVLGLPPIEAVRSLVAAATNRDAAQVMLLLSATSDNGADVRQLAEELVSQFRALLLVRVGAGAALTDELSSAEVAWLQDQAQHWTSSGLIELVQTMSQSLARTRDAQQFQVQLELALLTSCGSAGGVVPRPPPGSSATVPDPDPPVQRAAPRRLADPPAALAASTDTMARIRSEEPGEGATAPVVAVVPPNPGAAFATDLPVATVDDGEDQELRAVRDRWPDVVEYVLGKRKLLGALITHARPIRANGQLVTLEFETEFNRNRAEAAANRQVIEDGIHHALGRSCRLRCVVASAADGPSLLDDPVISYAARTFGGQPRRVELAPSGALS